MRKSQEQVQVEAPKKRVSRAKAVTQESTVLEDSEGMTGLSKNLSNERKVRAGTGAKKNTMQQEVKWKDTGKQGSRKKSLEKTGRHHPLWSRVRKTREEGG